MFKISKALFPLLFSLLFLLSGCIICPQHYVLDDDPPPLPDCYYPDKVRLALVLGGGGAKGMAHVGVLEEFEKANIPIDLIIGCSAGSIVGALYADNPDASYVKAQLAPLRTKSMLDINLWTARYGLSQGRSLRKVLDYNLDSKDFRELKIPFLLVATDLYSSELVTIGGGPIVPAVMASSAFPFVFVPVELHGRVFVDGGVIDPVPVRVAHQLGADIIVAVDLRGLLPRTFPDNLFGVMNRSAEITLLWQSEACLKCADVVIRPECGDAGTFDDKDKYRVYEAGKIAAREAIPAILEKLQQREERLKNEANNL